MPLDDEVVVPSAVDVDNGSGPVVGTVDSLVDTSAVLEP